ncbi:hypothetical protein TNCV_2562531 [Trichonephila clavipes]|uniref:Uncharacterized protein n=1 Tax=Trichonephila clavipes TaxID=2585209 RepID=A0A8X6R6I9_TRICX|nr:hypothetical protein TNCV_2562531 [Trichonephila clavipes]
MGSWSLRVKSFFTRKKKSKWQQDFLGKNRKNKLGFSEADEFNAYVNEKQTKSRLPEKKKGFIPLFSFPAHVSRFLKKKQEMDTCKGNVLPIRARQIGLRRLCGQCK